jgi:S-adenosylmethionine decarboxylase
MNGGREWVVDVGGLPGEALTGARGVANLRGLFAALVVELGLHPLHEPVAHVFGGPGGVTLFVALSESHLAAHSYPEAGYLSLNLYTCRARPGPDWAGLVERFVGRGEVRVRTLERGTGVVAASVVEPGAARR